MALSLKSMSPKNPIHLTEATILAGVRGEPGEHRSGPSGKKNVRRLEGKPKTKLLIVGSRMAKMHGCGFGIDPLLAASGCAKASLYGIYGSKDGLLAAICAAEQVEYQRLLLGVDVLFKKPNEIVMELTGALLQSFRNPDSHLGVSVQVLLTEPAETSRGGLPLALKAAALTVKCLPNHLRNRLSSIQDLNFADNFDGAAQEYFKALLLAAVTPRLFPAEKPEKQPALLSAIESLAAEVSVRILEAGSTARVYATE